MHDRRAEAADHLHVGRGFRAQGEVIEILDQREPRTDGESRDRRIDEQSDAPPADQVNQDQRLEQLLEPRGDVAHVNRERDVREVEQRPVERIAHAGGHGAGGHHGQGDARPDEPEAVEVDERQQEHEHRQQRDRRPREHERAHLGRLRSAGVIRAP